MCEVVHIEKSSRSDYFIGNFHGLNAYVHGAFK